MRTAHGHHTKYILCELALHASRQHMWAANKHILGQLALYDSNSTCVRTTVCQHQTKYWFKKRPKISDTSEIKALECCLSQNKICNQELPQAPKELAFVTMEQDSEAASREQTCRGGDAGFPFSHELSPKP